MKAQPFLMFQGQAAEAMSFYVSVFPGARVDSIETYGPGQTGPEGTVFRASFTVAGQTILCIDSPAVHAFTFTPATSFFVTVDTIEQFDRISSALSEEGQVLMPPGNYGFSRKFTWVNDKFGVSWQLNLE